jgi:hypothetical protein
MMTVKRRSFVNKFRIALSSPHKQFPEPSWPFHFYAHGRDLSAGAVAYGRSGCGFFHKVPAWSKLVFSQANCRFLPCLSAAIRMTIGIAPHMTAAIGSLQSSVARFTKDDGEQCHSACDDYRFFEELSPGQLMTIGYFENERLCAEAQLRGVARESCL